VFSKPNLALTQVSAGDYSLKKQGVNSTRKL